MNRKLLAAGVAIGGLLAAGRAGAALTISVSPASLAWNTNAWLDVVVSNLPPAARVELSLWGDLDRDGTVQTNRDQLWACYRLRDGETNALGSFVIPDDEDALANGVIRTRVSYHGVDGILHVAGAYVWRAVNATGGPAVAARFDVTQPPTDRWVTGRVLDYYTSNAIPGAIVEWAAFSSLHFRSRTFTATNGFFRLDLPAGMPPDDVAGVLAMGVRHVQDMRELGGLKFVSAVAITNLLQAGENPLPAPLYLLSLRSGLTHRVSGRVLDAGGAPVPGVLIGFQDESEDYLAVGVSAGTNGAYELTVPHGARGGFGLESAWLNRLGLVSAGQWLGAVTSDLAGVDIHLDRANALARSTVRDAESGAPIVGVEVGFEIEGAAECRTYTVGDGAYDLAVLTGFSYHATANDSIEEQGYVPPESSNGVAIAAAGVFTNVPFRARRGYPLSGHVYDAATNALTGEAVYAYPLGAGWRWLSAAEANWYGSYRMLVHTGLYRVVAEGFDGFLGQAYADYYTWEWDPVENRARGDPVAVTAAGCANINFYLPPAAYIRGEVRGDLAVLENVRVSAEAITDEEFEYRGDTHTDADGAYALAVPAGTNYGVYAQDTADDTYWVGRWYYDGIHGPDEITRVATALGAPATNINIRLARGGAIAGFVFEDDGMTPVPSAWVEVREADERGAFVEGDGTGDDGSYRVAVSGGVYHVRAEADGWVAQYYDGVFEPQRRSAALVTVEVWRTAGEINFALTRGGILSGQVRDEEDWEGIADCSVYAEDYASGEWAGGADSDGDGYYYINLPPGDYRVRAVPSGSGLEYLDEWYDDTSQREQAEAVTVWDGDETGEIDFELRAPSYIEGDVFGDGAPAEGVGLVATAVPDPSRFWSDWQFLDFTESDSAGGYTLRVPPGSNYFVRTQSGATFYPQTAWSNALDLEDATLLSVGVRDTVAGIDFRLQAGAKFTGQVLDEAGAPLAEARVDASYRDGESRWYDRGGDDADGEGRYEFAVPLGTGYFVRAAVFNDSWYPETFYSNRFTPDLARLFTARVARTTFSNVNFRLYPGYRVQGFVCGSDGLTPAPDGFVQSRDAADRYCAGAPSDGSGWYELTIPQSVPYIQGSADGYVAEYYDNAYGFAQASSVAAPPKSTIRADFTLYAQDEDADGDGVRDWEEDARPDGVYSPAEDWASRTNVNTDGDAASDYHEWVAATDPRDPDSWFGVQAVSREPGGVIRLEWDGAGMRSYRVLGDDALADIGTWPELWSTSTAASGPLRFRDAPPAGRRFYRLTVERLP